MQQHFGRFGQRIVIDLPFGRRDSEWRFFYRDFFSMFLRWTRPITLSDGTQSREPRLMRRKVGGRWQYRVLNDRELRYILSVENGTHC